jgi:hypothetical protein
MKFTVIGSTSPTGLHILEQGVKRGHGIVAFTRRPQQLDAIVGVRGQGRTTIAANVTRVLLKAMQEEQIQRLVCVSSYLAGPATGQPGRFFKWLMRHPLADRSSVLLDVVESKDVSGSVINVSWAKRGNQ